MSAYLPLHFLDVSHWPNVTRGEVRPHPRNMLNIRCTCQAYKTLLILAAASRSVAGTIMVTDDPELTLVFPLVVSYLQFYIPGLVSKGRNRGVLLSSNTVGGHRELLVQASNLPQNAKPAISLFCGFERCPCLHSFSASSFDILCQAWPPLLE